MEVAFAVIALFVYACSEVWHEPVYGAAAAASQAEKKPLMFILRNSEGQRSWHKCQQCCPCVLCIGLQGIVEIRTSPTFRGQTIITAFKERGIMVSSWLFISSVSHSRYNPKQPRPLIVLLWKVYQSNLFFCLLVWIDALSHLPNTVEEAKNKKRTRKINAKTQHRHLLTPLRAIWSALQQRSFHLNAAVSSDLSLRQAAKQNNHLSQIQLCPHLSIFD